MSAVTSQLLHRGKCEDDLGDRLPEWQNLKTRKSPMFCRHKGWSSIKKHVEWNSLNQAYKISLKGSLLLYRSTYSQLMIVSRELIGSFFTWTTVMSKLPSVSLHIRTTRSKPAVAITDAAWGWNCTLNKKITLIVQNFCFFRVCYNDYMFK